jgi:dTMP kinase
VGAGLEVVETREPGGSAGAEAIRGLLMRGDEDRWSPAAEALLFAAAAPTMSAARSGRRWRRGNGCCATASCTSSLAYQALPAGSARRRSPRLHDIGSGGLLPTACCCSGCRRGGARMSLRDGRASTASARRREAFTARGRGFLAWRRQTERFGSSPRGGEEVTTGR